MSRQNRRQDVKEAQEHKKKTAIHNRNLQSIQGQSGGHDRGRIIEITTESELTSPSGSLENLKAKDFPLANYDELADSFEFKGLQEIFAVIDDARHPHPDSVLQGAVREWAFDDPNESLEARSPSEAIENETYLLGTYSRATRGEEGFQQETAAKQTRESITVDEDKGGSGGRLRSKIPGL